jgi:trehalose/maltose transport system substrate-binding protein
VVKTLNADTRFSIYERLFQAESTEIDVLMLDVIWPGHFAQNLVDLKPRFEDIKAQYDSDLIDNNTIDGRLIAIPWFQNFGMLYYRSDLLEKYGFQVPETWAELEEQARQIMAGEQAGNPHFTGFVWQGATYEGLTCNALEWIYSQGGGTIVDQNGEVDIDNPEAAGALDRARRWVGTISPREVTSYMEGDALNRFRSGNAAFMRNWPYAYALSNAQDSPIKGKFDIAPLPHAENGRSAGTVGGWQLSVSSYSKSPEASIEFVRYMTSPEVQRWRALVGSYIPTIEALREESEVRERVYALTILPQMDLIVRPSGLANASYPELSRSFFLGVKEILERRDAGSILPMIQDRIENRVLSRE